MLNELYRAKNGTLHVVRVLDIVREFTKGEKMENTAAKQLGVSKPTILNIRHNRIYKTIGDNDA